MRAVIRGAVVDTESKPWKANPARFNHRFFYRAEGSSERYGSDMVEVGAASDLPGVGELIEAEVSITARVYEGRPFLRVFMVQRLDKGLHAVASSK